MKKKWLIINKKVNVELIIELLGVKKWKND